MLVFSGRGFRPKENSARDARGLVVRMTARHRGPGRELGLDLLSDCRRTHEDTPVAATVARSSLDTTAAKQHQISARHQPQ